MPKLLTTLQVAERTAKHHSMIRRAIANGWLKATLYGKTNLVSEKDLQRWLDTGAKVYPKNENAMK